MEEKKEMKEKSGTLRWNLKRVIYLREIRPKLGDI